MAGKLLQRVTLSQDPAAIVTFERQGISAFNSECWLYRLARIGNAGRIGATNNPLNDPRKRDSLFLDDFVVTDYVNGRFRRNQSYLVDLFGHELAILYLDNVLCTKLFARDV